MNKNYIKPKMEIIKLQTADIIQTSALPGDGTTPKNVINSKVSAPLAKTNHIDVFE